MAAGQNMLKLPALISLILSAYLIMAYFGLKVKLGNKKADTH